MAGKKKARRRADGRRATMAAVGLCALLMAGVLLGLLFPDAGGEKTSSAFGIARSAENDVCINEVMASNTSTLMLKDGSLPDWVEIRNTGLETAFLGGYALMAGEDPKSIFKFPSVSLQPGRTLVVYADGGTAVSPGELHATFKLSSSGERLTLMDASGAAIDAVDVPSLERNEVYCRDEAGAWKISAAPTPGASNRIVARGQGSSAGKLTAAGGSSILVTEVMSRNATYAVTGSGEAADYIEVTNVSGSSVNLEGWMLTDDQENLAAWTFPRMNLAAGESRLVYCSGSNRSDDPMDLHAGFRLSGDGETVVLTSRTGVIASVVKVPALERDQAYSLVGGRWTAYFAPTPGSENTLQNAWRIGEEIQKASGWGVMISEVSAAASDTTPDWIEFYNAGTETADLSGCYLSDDPGKPKGWQFPQGTVIAPGAYTAVFCSGENKPQNGWQHTSFKLSATGGYTLALSRSDGTLADRLFVPRQYEDMTYGRGAAQDGFFYFAQSTPVAANDAARYLGRAQTPDYSVKGGMFSGGEVLTVQLKAESSARIYYTLDCTDPTESSTLYTEPIVITKNTVLRTRVYQNGYLESFADTQSYLYDVNNGNGAFVVSLVSDPSNLLDEETGIMSKGNHASDTYPYKGANYWNDWEREAHVEIYDGQGEPVLSQGCGIKLHGQYSRAEQQQAFKVIARTKYGDSLFHAALFSNRPYQEYQSFLLRSSGQDTKMTRMRDSVLTELASDTSVMYQETEICVLYLDGVYWGQYNLRERINTASICQFEGWEGQEDDLDLIKGNNSVMQGSNETFKQLVEYAKKADPTTDEFYENLGRVIDIENYIEYMSLEIFVGNGDTLNVKRYRNPNTDGKWRWVVFDLDWAFFVDTNSISRWLAPGGMGTKKFTDNSLFIACMKNPRFKDEFLTYIGKRMATVFTTEYVLSRIQARLEILAPLLPEQLARWGQTQKSYDQAMTKLINYAKNRPTKLLKYFQTCEALGLTTEEMYHYFGDALEVIQNYAAK